MTLSSGTRIGPYEILAPLGAGGMGEVFRARDGLAAGAEPASVRALEIYLAARTGRTAEAKSLLDDRSIEARRGVVEIVALASALVQLGEPGRALSVLEEPVMQGLVPIEVRLEPELHSLLDHAQFAPRRWDVTLVWPLEAPMIDRARFRVFREVKIESGLPEGTDVR